jgi:Flp pilus assembly CpaE family ATPase
VGVTTLAVDLALTAALVSQRGTCLIDLSPASGQAALHLRVPSQKSWEELPQLGINPTVENLTGLLTPHPSGLQLLASPFEPIHAQTLTAPITEGALRSLKNQFDLLVIDAPSIINEAAAVALDQSNVILLVITPEVGAIQATRALLQVMSDMLDKVLLVLNHVSPQPGVPKSALEKALGRPVAVEVAFDPAQATALAQGKPLPMSQPNATLTRASRQLLAAVGKKITGRPPLRRLARS